MRGENRKVFNLSLGDYHTEEEANAQLQKYHDLVLGEQLKGIPQEEIFEWVKAIRHQQRKDTGARMHASWFKGY